MSHTYDEDAPRFEKIKRKKPSDKKRDQNRGLRKHRKGGKNNVK